MARKKKVEEPVLEVKKGLNPGIGEEAEPAEPIHGYAKRALIKFKDGETFKMHWYDDDHYIAVVDTDTGDFLAGGLGVQYSYVPTINVTFQIPESLGNESNINLLKNTFRMIKRQPSAEFQLFSTYQAITPAQTGTFPVDGIVFRYTGASYMAYADWSNLSGYVVTASDMVNCTRADSPTANIVITDQTKDASITLTITLPEPEPDPEEPGE